MGAARFARRTLTVLAAAAVLTGVLDGCTGQPPPAPAPVTDAVPDVMYPPGPGGQTCADWPAMTGRDVWVRGLYGAATLPAEDVADVIRRLTAFCRQHPAESLSDSAGFVFGCWRWDQLTPDERAALDGIGDDTYGLVKPYPCPELGGAAPATPTGALPIRGATGTL